MPRLQIRILGGALAATLLLFGAAPTGRAQQAQGADGAARGARDAAPGANTAARNQKAANADDVARKASETAVGKADQSAARADQVAGDASARDKKCPCCGVEIGDPTKPETLEYLCYTTRPADPRWCPVCPPVLLVPARPAAPAAGAPSPGVPAPVAPVPGGHSVRPVAPMDHTQFKEEKKEKAGETPNRKMPSPEAGRVATGGDSR